MSRRLQNLPFVWCVSQMLGVSAYCLCFHKFDVLIKAKPMKIKVVLYHLRAIMLCKFFDILLKYNIHTGKKMHINVSSVNFYQMNLILCIQGQELEHYCTQKSLGQITIQTPKATTFLTSNSMNLFSYFCVLYKWNYTVNILFCLTSFEQHDVCESNPCCWV